MWLPTQEVKEKMLESVEQSKCKLEIQLINAQRHSKEQASAVATLKSQLNHVLIILKENNIPSTLEDPSPNQSSRDSNPNNESNVFKDRRSFQAEKDNDLELEEKLKRARKMRVTMKRAIADKRRANESKQVGHLQGTFLSFSIPSSTIYILLVL